MQKEYSSYLLNKSVIDSESDDEENSVENLKTKRLTSHLYSEKDIKAKRGDVLFEEEEFLILRRFQIHFLICKEFYYFSD